MNVALVVIYDPSYPGTNNILHGLRREFGQWSVPGGKGKEGESPEQTAVRELYEEVGVTLDPKQLVLLTKKEYPTKTVYLFKAPYPKGQRMTWKFDPDKEFGAFQFMDPTKQTNIYPCEEHNLVVEYLKGKGMKSIKAALNQVIAKSKYDKHMEAIGEELTAKGMGDPVFPISKEELERTMRTIDQYIPYKEANRNEATADDKSDYSPETQAGIDHLERLAQALKQAGIDVTDNNRKPLEDAVADTKYVIQNIDRPTNANLAGSLYITWDAPEVSDGIFSVFFKGRNYYAGPSHEGSTFGLGPEQEIKYTTKPTIKQILSEYNKWVAKEKTEKQTSL